MNALKTIFCISIIFLSCEKGESGLQIDPRLNYSFAGTFTVKNTLHSGTVYLELDSGRYNCTTDTPFGRGAGRFAADNNEIEFTDTLFFPVPAIYDPSWVISGKYVYTYDGSELKLFRKLNAGTIRYELSKTN